MFTRGVHAKKVPFKITLYFGNYEKGKFLIVNSNKVVVE
jgi:hypothetical protein